MSRFFAPCAPGLETVLAAELHGLGIDDVKTTRGGANFSGTLEDGARVCLWSRVAIRVQEELLSTQVHKPKSLYNAVQRVDWSRYLTNDQTLAIHSATRDSKMRHAGHAALVVKDAIVDQFRDHTGERPSVDKDEPDLPLKLVMRNNQALLYRDLAGDSLHRRGWRPIQVKSPLNESVAAGLMLLTDWDRKTPLVDPMCGSGTLIIEAAHIAGDRAPGLARHFAFENWPDAASAQFDGHLQMARERWARGKERIGTLMASDRHSGALEIAQQSAEAAEVADCITFVNKSVDQLVPPDGAMVVTNPPWGRRIGDPGDVETTWRDLGKWLKDGTSGGEAWVLSGNPELTKFLKMRARQKFPVQIGPVTTRWIAYPLRARPVEAATDADQG